MATARRKPRTIHRLVIDGWHPCPLNRLLGCHWRTRARRKRGDCQLIVAYARLQAIPPATGKRRVSLHLTLVRRQRAGDPDCYWKSLLDALVHAGLLLDDNRQGVELGSVTFDRGPARQTTVILEDLAR
jgi:hypothetical protein